MNAVVEKPAPSVKQQPIVRLSQGVVVKPLADQLAANPQLWDRNVFRTKGGYGGPHSVSSDIIVRFNDWKNWHGSRGDFNGPHESVWWEAYDKLTYVKPLVFDLARLLEAEQIGMVLITRVPPHSEIGWHIDRGWHATYYNKFLVQIQANEQQKFCYRKFELVTATGDLCEFRNDIPHRVVNDSDEDRISLIVCLRQKQRTCYDCRWDGRL